MKIRRIVTNQQILLGLILCSAQLCFAQTSPKTITNPIIDGYYADPSILKQNNSFYVYATIDPWGGKELGAFESKNLLQWEKKKLNWPTKLACTSPTSSSSMVWAPSVVKAVNGKFYMYVSVGSEVWAGISDHPLGPWKNAKADNSPLIKGNLFPGYHMIDAECFIDSDGQAYLYWGSGINWVNGKCFVVKLKNDMVTFEGEIKDVTPPNYFEGPFMVKHKGTYYLMYSDGLCYNHTYKVRYSTGKSPYGPWKEGANSPILSSTPDSTTIGPGHHAVFQEKEQYYILYHRVFKSSGPDGLLRQLCIDSLKFDASGNMLKVQPQGIKTIDNQL